MKQLLSFKVASVTQSLIRGNPGLVTTTARVFGSDDCSGVNDHHGTHNCCTQCNNRSAATSWRDGETVHPAGYSSCIERCQKINVQSLPYYTCNISVDNILSVINPLFYAAPDGDVSNTYEPKNTNNCNSAKVPGTDETMVKNGWWLSGIWGCLEPLWKIMGKSAIEASKEGMVKLIVWYISFLLFLFYRHWFNLITY